MLQLQDNSMTPLSPSGFNFHLCIINLLLISNKTLRKKLHFKIIQNTDRLVHINIYITFCINSGSFL